VATLSSILLGPISWIMAGVVGCSVWDTAQNIVNAFERQCPLIANYVVARAVMYQRNISLETLR
jgi:hypothetical protein